MTIIQTREQAAPLARPGHAGVWRPGAPGGAGTQSGFTGRDFLRMLRKRKWLIALTVLIFTVVAVAATVLWAIYAPMYTAKAFLEVNPPEAGGLRTVGIPQMREDVMERLVQSRVNMVVIDPVLIEVLKAPSVQRTSWYQQIKGEDPVQALGDALNVGPVPTTNFISLSMTRPCKTEQEKADLAEIVNVVASAYVDFVQRNTSSEREAQIQRARDERLDLSQQLERERELLARARPRDYPNISEQSNVLSIRISVLTRQLTELELEKAQAGAALQSYRQALEAGEVMSIPSVKQMVDADPMVRQLRMAQVQMESARNTLAERFGPQHPRVKEIDTRLAGYSAQVEQRSQQAAREAVSAVLGNQQAAVDSLTSQVLQIREEYQQANAELRDLQATMSEVRMRSNMVESLEEKIDLIDTRLLELRMVRRQERPVVVSVRAMPPREPSWPKWEILIPLGLMLGIMFGLGLAFLLEFVDTSIKGPSDIARRTDLPMLGIVPHADDIEEEIDDLRLAFATDPTSLFSEAFRQVRTTLLYSGPAEQRRSLLIASALPEDGRTTVALNLGASMAHGGRRVLVIDANFRQPAIGDLFEDCPDGGLSSALVGQAPWRDQVHEVEANLSVMAAGPLPPNPAELLGSEQMRQIIAEATETYDQVIFDGAPCLLVTDSSILGTMVDGVILTVRAGANTYGVVQRTREIFVRVGARILGVVLNGMRVTAGGYLQKNYDAFYEYHVRGRGQLPSKQDA